MNYIFVAILAYFIIALATINDKFLLTSNKVSHPAIYAFYSGLISFFTFVLLPFGGNWIGFTNFFQYIIFGIIFHYGVLCLFYAIQKNQASQVIPVNGAIVPIVTFFISVLFFKALFNFTQIIWVILLIGGGLLISLHLKNNAKGKRFFDGFKYAVLSGALMGMAFAAFEIFYQKDSFINVFVWTRLGLVLGAISLLFFSYWRRTILKTCTGFKKNRSGNASTGIFFTANKLLNGIGSIVLNYAIALGGVGGATVVNAMVSIEYVFVFLIGLLLSLRYARIFQEEISAADILKKIVAIILISVGIIMVLAKYSIKI